MWGASEQYDLAPVMHADFNVEQPEREGDFETDHPKDLQSALCQTETQNKTLADRSQVVWRAEFVRKTGGDCNYAATRRVATG